MQMYTDLHKDLIVPYSPVCSKTSLLSFIFVSLTSYETQTDPHSNK